LTGGKRIRVSLTFAPQPMLGSDVKTAIDGPLSRVALLGVTTTDLTPLLRRCARARIVAGAPTAARVARNHDETTYHGTALRHSSKTRCPQMALHRATAGRPRRSRCR